MIYEYIQDNTTEQESTDTKKLPHPELSTE